MDLSAIDPILLLASLIVASTPILLAALGELVVERAGVLNLGVEGMMITGAICGFAIAVNTGSPVAGFVAASVACGLSWSLTSMVAFRVLQGVFGAAIVPLAQTFMLDINPPERQGQAMAMWGAGIMVGPIIGPTLGGWLTESFNWRWVFFINVPVGIVAFLGCAVAGLAVVPLLRQVARAQNAGAVGHFQHVGHVGRHRNVEQRGIFDVMHHVQHAA